MKSKRRNDLLKILRSGSASSQEEIGDQLKAAGHDVTQATISRDLREMGAVKVKAGTDHFYRLVDDVAPGESIDLTDDNLRRTLVQFAVDIRVAGSFVIVTTPPGHANAVARAIDLAAPADAAGTIAGDDTIFIATTGAGAANRLARRFDGMATTEEVAS